MRTKLFISFHTLLDVDSEVDKFLTTTLLRYNTEEKEIEEKKRGPSSITHVSTEFESHEICKDLAIEDVSGGAVEVNSWDFNVNAIQKPPRTSFQSNLELIFIDLVLPLVAMELFQQYSFFDKLQLDKAKLQNFLEQVAQGYFDNP